MTYSLPEITSYDEKTLLSARQQSPALERYLQLLERASRGLNFNNQLRLKRQRHWCKAALATLTGSAHPKEVCGYWSQESLKIIKEAWEHVGGLGFDVSILAVGKLGAGELNLSSDIDILFVCGHTPEKNEHKLVRQFVNLLNEVTDYGFCYRVDTDLRPGGRMGPVITSISQFEDYYWTQGLTWERVAFVRLNPIVGPTELLERIGNIVKKFSYRKYIDFNLFEDIKDLRSKIREQYYTADSGDSINLKTVAGGIRDLELYINVLQVIHGGRDPSLQVQSTSSAIQKMIAAKVLDKDTLVRLEKSYWTLRRAENLVQSLRDQQTHVRKKNLSLKDFHLEEYENLRGICEENNALVSQLLGVEVNKPTALPPQVSEQKKWLISLGFNEKSVNETWPQLLGMTARSSRGDKDELARKELLSQFVIALSEKSLDQDLGLSMFSDFIHNTRAKTSFFTLLLREPRMISELAVLFSTSPYLGGLIVSRPELIDSFLYRRQVSSFFDTEELLEELNERKQLTEIYSTLDFWNDQDTENMTGQLTKTADKICIQLLGHIQEKMTTAPLDLLCLGKWASFEMGLKSDLDFVFVSQKTAGPNELKACKRFISYLTQQSRGGKIYSIDLRLRPSGHAGPLIVPISRITEFIKNEAEAWQRQAYLRSRVLLDKTTSIIPVVLERGLEAQEIGTLKSIRDQLKKENLKDTLDLKYSSGGLIDIEFAAQTAVLYKQISVDSGNTTHLIRRLQANSSEWETSGIRLSKIYMSLRQTEQMHQITSRTSGSGLKEEEESTQRLCRFLKLDYSQLENHLRALMNESATILKDLDPINSPR